MGGGVWACAGVVARARTARVVKVARVAVVMADTMMLCALIARLLP
jgi:hypothetical protein